LSKAVQFPSKIPPAPQGKGGRFQTIVDAFLSLLFFVLAVFSDLLQHITWYNEAVHQAVHVHHIV
jgi:hypothetical protein